MGLLRGISRAAPLVAAGLAAGWYLRRQGLLGAPAHTQLPGPPEPTPPPPEDAQPPAAETRVREVVEPEHEEPPIEAHVEAVEAVSDAADVTAVVEDLLVVPPGDEQQIVDAEVVDEGGIDLAESVRVALAEIPGLLPDAMAIETAGGVVWLRGELERPEAIAEAERRAASVSGVTEVHNLLHLPGTPPPTR
jgi:hypothetical protein